MLTLTLTEYELLDLLWAIQKAIDSGEMDTDNLTQIKYRIHKSASK